MGDVLLQLHRYAEAVKPLNKALILIKAAPSLTPNLPTAGLLHALLGKASWGLGRLQAGDEYFRRALELDPHNMKTIEYVAAAHFRQKRYQAGARSVSDPVGDRSRKGSDSRRHRRNLVLPGPNGRSNPEPGTRSLPGPNPGNGQNQPRITPSPQGKELSTKLHEGLRRDTKGLEEAQEGFAKGREGGPPTVSNRGKRVIHEGDPRRTRRCPRRNGKRKKSYPRSYTKG